MISHFVTALFYAIFHCILSSGLGRRVAQFSFGFYSLMLTSLLIGLIVMVLYKPRTWCAFCPMGTMTQSICKLKNKD